MTASSVTLEVFHVVVAMLFVAGLVGRAASFDRAGRAQAIHVVESLLQLSEWFEQTLVIPMYVAVLITGPLTAWIAGWPLWPDSGAPKWPFVSLVLFLSPMLFIPSYLAPRRKQRHQALADAVSQEKVTAELAAALHDRGVRLLRQLEYLLTGIVTVLMVAKPF